MRMRHFDKVQDPPKELFLQALWRYCTATMYIVYYMHITNTCDSETNHKTHGTIKHGNSIRREFTKKLGTWAQACQIRRVWKMEVSGNL